MMSRMAPCMVEPGLQERCLSLGIWWLPLCAEGGKLVMSPALYRRYQGRVEMANEV
jgi:hypothetical protein